MSLQARSTSIDLAFRDVMDGNPGLGSPMGCCCDRTATSRGCVHATVRVHALMLVFKLILLVAALVLFLLAAIGVPAGRFSLVAFGLACWVATVLMDVANAAG